MSLYHKYAFTDLDDLVGNEDAIATIRAHFAQPKEKWSHAWMISGPGGCGKNLLANIIATQYLGAIPELSLIENNTGSSRGIDAFREIYKRVQSKPIGATNWVVLVNEAQGLTTDARDSMLVPLEKAASNVFYIFCSTSPESLYKGKEGEAFATRLTKISVTPVAPDAMFRFLRRIVKLEGATNVDNDVLRYIAEVCDGSPRKALTFLDMVLPLEDSEQMMRVITQGPDDQDPTLLELCQSIMKGSFSESAALLKQLKGTLQEEKIRHAIMGYFASVGLSGNSRAVTVLEAFSRNTYDNGFPMLVLSLLKAYGK